MKISIIVPHSAVQLNAVRDLMRTFTRWHRQSHPADLHLIDRYFDAAAFATELAGLPGKYAPPDGQLLLARADGAAAGCVALRRIDATSCEMKRMFVYPEYHGRGVGRALGEAIVEEARTLGYTRMRLDTSFRQIEALRLYQRLGFQSIQPYYELPDELRNWLVFMELVLTPLLAQQASARRAAA